MDPANEPLSQQGNKYEVFLSLSRSEDTRKSFPSRINSFLRKARSEDTQESFSSCLYSYLRKSRISVFKGDGSIEGCKISIIIFSIHYASSTRCLKELTKIMELNKSHDQVVLPVFYGVDPYEVRDQTCSFGEAFIGLMQRISPTKDEVLRWKRALNEAGGTHGFVVRNFEPNNEIVVIKNIVEHVRHMLDTNNVPFVTWGSVVGMSSQVHEVTAMLRSHRSKDVVSIGIWGMGDSGKSTLARVIFAEFRKEFENICFLSIVRRKWEHKDSVISAAKKMRIDSHNKKLLLVVDDVDHVEQLHAICGNPKWFGLGSRIIITTRDLHLLEAFPVDLVYSMKLLSDHVSLQLFSRKAFKQASPEGDFMELSRRVVAYAEGLPLALEVFGSFLCGRSPREWKLAMMKLTSTDLHPDIYNILEISFDSLDANEKEIFLNIVSLYIGMQKSDAVQKLDAHGCNAIIGIRNLMDRSLVTIDNDNKLRVHNLLQLMGRQIMRKTSQRKTQYGGDRYEVFLSFRGDTRATFTSHLYSALCNAGITVFKDDIELLRGKHIKTELLEAIGSSKIAIIIFSREYAGSKWCLEELSMFMELHKYNNQIVLPVFYDVDPSEIRHQTSSFGEAFEDLIQRTSQPEVQVSNWRKALNEAGGIAGIVVLGSRG